MVKVFGNKGNGTRKELSLPDPRPQPPEPDTPEFYGMEHGAAYPKVGVDVDMKQLEYETADNITKIAMLMRSLTYGEFVQMTNEIKAIDPDAQVIKPESTLAGVLHEWSERKR